MAEREIIKKIKSGKDEGAEDLLRHYGPLIRYVIKPILADEHDREECLHDVVMAV